MAPIPLQQARTLLGQKLTELDDPVTIAHAASQILGEALDVSRVGYGTVDPVAETMTIERDWNAEGTFTLAGVLRFRDYGSYIEDLKRGETVVFEDATNDPRTSATHPALTAIHAQSAVNLPVTEQGGLVGLLYVNHRTARKWSSEDLALINEFGERTRAAIARRVAEGKLQDFIKSLESEVAQRTKERDRTWNNSQDLLCVVDGDGTFLSANPAWTSLLGWTVAEVVGRNHLDFSHPDDKSGSQGALQTAQSGPLKRYENRMPHKDGSFRWVSWTASAEQGLVYASGRDVTAEKEAAADLEAAQEQLRQSQKMEAVGQLTGGLAHDFNNLLTGITGSLELLQVRFSQGRVADAERYILAAQGAAKRAAALTHRLLAFSRRQTLDPKVVDVNRLVADMEEMVRRTAGPDVTVEVVGATGLWATLVDGNQLENALLNLCINSRDAMPNGGRLTIETANRWFDERAARDRDVAPGQYISLCITDTGTGMTSEVAARAFDPFFTTKPLGAGTGLGLSMVYGFARQSGGQVRIYSEAESGTTICIYLPRVLREGDDPSPDQEVEHETQVPSGKTVLVIDDEPTVRMLLSDVLREEGMNALEAADGAAGLAVLRSDVPIDLLVTDVGLPGGLNGRQVADAARLLRPGLKVLFITGYAENAALGHGLLDPGMSVLTKPFSISSLARRLHELIGTA